MSIPNYKDIVELLKKGLTIEAQEKIMELREAAMELQEENLGLREKVADLEAQIKRTKELKLTQGVYWREGDTVPLCQVCYDKDSKLIHLSEFHLVAGRMYCPVCKFQVDTGRKK